MRIRVKILLTLCVIIVTLMALFYAVALSIMFGSIHTLETAHSTQSAMRFQNALNRTISQMVNVVNDWANWDDTYSFVQTNSSQYVSSNIVGDTFNNLHLNLMLFYDENGNLVSGTQYDLERQTFTALNQGTLADVAGYSCLLAATPDCTRSGVIMVDGAPLMVAAHPILTSMAQGPSRGTMIIGRFLDEAEVAVLSSDIQLPIALTLYNAGSMSKAQYLSAAQPVFIEPQNDTAIAAYVLVNDLAGEPSFVVRLDEYRADYAQGNAMALSFSLASVGVIVVMFVCIAFLLDKVVVSRLSGLNSAVLGIRGATGSSIRVEEAGTDELSSLGRNINQMLDVIDDNTVALERTVRERTRDLSENQKKLESILLASPDAIVAFDLDGVITECNLRVTELSGFDRSYLIGKEGIQFIAEQSRAQVVQQISKLRTKNCGAVQFEAAFCTRDNRVIPVEFSISPVKDEHDQTVGVVGIIRDLSEKKLLEQQLLKSQRLAAIGELAGMVGHDIRNPLAAIRNADWFIKKKCGGCDKSQIAPMLDVIDKSIEHANSIVDDLLEYSREQHLELIALPAKMLIDKALLMIKVPSKVNLVNAVDDSPIHVDESKVVRVFVNLTKNALDAMPEGGTLEIKTVKDAQYTSVVFSDTGKGISEDVMSKLFTPLFTTKAQGMGFGLSISKRIVEAHGGKIAVQSIAGQGSVFTVFFPNSPNVGAPKS